MIMMQYWQGETDTRRSLKEFSIDEFKLDKEWVGLVHMSIQYESVKNNHNASLQTIIEILRFFIITFRYLAIGCLQIKK